MYGEASNSNNIIPLGYQKIRKTVVVEETCVVAWTLTCERKAISKLECLMVSAITRLNDYGVLIGRGESLGEGQSHQFSPIGRRDS